MKNYFSVLIFIAICHLANAQIMIGARLGLNYSGYNYKGSLTQNENFENLPSGGFNGALIFPLRVSELFVIQPELGYTLRGGGFVSIPNNKAKYKYSDYFSYYSIPLLLKLGNSSSFNIGGYVDIMHLAIRSIERDSLPLNKGYVTLFDGAVPKDNNIYNPIDVGLCGGFTFKRYEDLGLFVDLRAQYGLSNLYKSSQFNGGTLKATHFSILANIGYTFWSSEDLFSNMQYNASAKKQRKANEEREKQERLLMPYTTCSLADEGQNKINKGNYLQAKDIFNDLLSKNAKCVHAYDGLATVAAYNKDYEEAIKNESKAIELENSNMEFRYKRACYYAASKKNNEALNDLYDITENSFKARAIKDNYFKDLITTEQFVRWVAGIRRLKISPIMATSHDNDGLDENDLLVVAVYENQVILTTPVTENKNSVEWNSEVTDKSYVILDYHVDSKMKIILLEEDVIKHDILATKETFLKPSHLSVIGDNGVSYAECLIEDTEDMPYTTGTYIAPEVNIADFLLIVGGAVMIISGDELNHTILGKIIKCSMYSGVGSLVESPTQSAILEEAFASVVEKRKMSISNIGESILISELVEELERKGQKELAELVKTGSLIKCILD